MPFPMIHLSIAYKILENNAKIIDEAAFNLGSISPDEVHFRNNYHSGMKKISHICNSKKSWGTVNVIKLS